jgi:hypothetical protein
MANVAEIDPRDITVTPIFRMMEIENVPKSEEAGHLVKELHEVVQVRFAGSNNYSPIFPAHAFWKREGNQVITYAERWKDQYRDFKEGNSQQVTGTPLEMLMPYGITPEQLSLCRAMRVYSIEAMHALEGSNLKNLGMNSNRLKEMANKYMSDRMSGKQALDRIAELEAKLAAMSRVIPVDEPTPEQAAEVVDIADTELLGAMTEDELRDFIFDKTGTKPDGRLKHESLVNLAKGL